MLSCSHLVLYRFQWGFVVVVVVVAAVAVVAFSYSLTFSLHSFRAMNSDLSLGCRALPDSSWELSEMEVKVARFGEVSL